MNENGKVVPKPSVDIVCVHCGDHFGGLIFINDEIRDDVIKVLEASQTVSLCNKWENNNWRQSMK
jgi:hypothetical protein